MQPSTIRLDEGMFHDLYDAISLLFSWRWPIVPGEVSAVDVERIKHHRGLIPFG